VPLLTTDVSLAITAGVYGVVAIIVKLDDIGLHLAERQSAGARAFGNGLVHVVPMLLVALSGLGTAAMLRVGGGIILHGLEEMRILEFVPHTVHERFVLTVPPQNDRRATAALAHAMRDVRGEWRLASPTNCQVSDADRRYRCRRARQNAGGVQR
jgi:predicted DNA repair protein MutK